MYTWRRKSRRLKSAPSVAVHQGMRPRARKISLPRVVRLRRPGSLSSVLPGSGELGPARLEERAHAVARLAHWRVVFVERLAVVEDHSDVGAELFSPFVSAGTNEETRLSAWIEQWKIQAASLHWSEISLPGWRSKQMLFENWLECVAALKPNIL